MLKKIIPKAALVIIAVLLSSCSGTVIEEEERVVNTKNLSTIEDNTADFAGYHVMAENDLLKLEFTGDKKSIKLTDLRNNHVWNSVYDYTQLDGEANDMWLANIKSLFNLVYIDKGAKVNDPQTAALIPSEEASDYDGFDFGDEENINTNVTNITKLDKGFRLDVYFTVLKLGIEIEFTLEGDSLNVFIPQNAITELGDNKLIGIYVLPFLGASNDKSDGYYVYPSGLGELYEFKSISERQNALNEVRLLVYADNTVDMDELTAISGPYGKRPAVLMPMFGVKLGNNAYMAHIIEGQNSSAINLIPSGTYVSANRIFGELIYRSHYDSKSDGLGAGDSDRKYVANLYDVDLIPGDRSMRFTFFNGDNAEYGTMANTYRNWLISSGQLSQTVKKDEKIPVSIDIANGIIKKYLMFEQFEVLTTFNQVKSFIGNLKDSGVESAVINLMGWSGTGLDQFPQSTGIAGKVGSKNDLKSLIGTAKQNGYKLMLNANLFDLDSKVGGFQMAAEAAMNKSFSQYVSMAGNRYLMNPRASLKRNESLISKYSDYGHNGFSYDRLGQYILNSSNKNGTTSNRQTAEIYDDILAKSKEIFGGAAVEGGNLYVAKNATLIKNLPFNYNTLPISDRQIPLYPMVMHGSIDYTSSPINLFYDSRQQILRLMEYGFIPSFTLTQSNANTLKDSTYNWLFTSEITVWQQTVIDTYKQFNDKLSAIRSSAITGYEEISTTVNKVTYENATAYFNYSSEPYQCEAGEVPAMDVLVVLK